MGKKLVIKGADFQQNAVNTDNEALYELMKNAFQVGKALSAAGGVSTNISVADNSTRCCIYDLDLSYFYNLGYRHLKINSATPTSYDLILGIGIKRVETYWYKSDGTTTNFSWQDKPESLEGTINSGNYLYINIKYDNDADFASTITLEDVISSVVLS